MREVTGRPAQQDDHVLFDFEGFIGEEPYMDGKKTDYFLELGKEMLLPGFDAEIIGLNPGDTKEFSLEIAEDYGDKQVAGKTIAFKIDFKSIKEKVLPELTDDFAKDVGEYETLEELKEAARKAISARKRQESETRVRDQIFDALIEKNSFTVPKGMVEMQAQNMLREIQRMFQQQGLDINEMGQSQEQMLENYREPAEKRVRSGLLLEAVANKENIKADEEDYEKQYEELASMYNEKLETIKENVSKEQLEPQIMERKTIDLILNSAEITDK
jgi:trigger factor